MSNMIFKISTGTLDAPNMFAFTEYRILIYVCTWFILWFILRNFIFASISYTNKNVPNFKRKEVKRDTLSLIIKSLLADIFVD